MNHKSIAGGIILFLILSSFNSITSSIENSSYNTIHVRPINLYANIIQEMIDNAEDGDIVIVNLSINRLKSIFLLN